MPKKQTTGKTVSQPETTTEESTTVSVPQQTSVSTTNDDNRVVGCVKWFDHQKGYGFVTQISAGEHYNEDIFVHQSNISTKEDTYRILYDGETITFDLQITDGEKHPYQAINVTGYQDISLQCENKAIHRSVRRTNNGNGNGNENQNRNNNRYNNDGKRYNNNNNNNNGGGRSTYNKKTNSNTRQKNNEPVEEV
jgi:cold shock protein